MAFYNPAAKEAILYYAQVMAGSWGYKPIVYAKRMGWLDANEKVTIEGQKLAKWIFESEPEFQQIYRNFYLTSSECFFAQLPVKIFALSAVQY